MLAAAGWLVQVVLDMIKGILDHILRTLLEFDSGFASIEVVVSEVSLLMCGHMMMIEGER